MTEVLRCLHHAQGLTVRAFADELRRPAIAVHTLDLPVGDGRSRQSDDYEVRPISARIGSRRRPTKPACASPTACPALSFTPGSPSASCRRRSWHKHGPALAAPCSSTPASRSAATGPSDPGRTASRSRSTAWTRTRSSPARAISTPPARSWRRSRTPSFSSIPATSTTSATADVRQDRRRLRRSPDASSAGTHLIIPRVDGSRGGEAETRV